MLATDEIFLLLLQYYWVLNVDEIIKASKKVKKKKEKAMEDIYEQIPNNVWKKHGEIQKM